MAAKERRFRPVQPTGIFEHLTLRCHFTGDQVTLEEVNEDGVFIMMRLH